MISHNYSNQKTETNFKIMQQINVFLYSNLFTKPLLLLKLWNCS
jgi:hypothetical protein